MQRRIPIVQLEQLTADGDGTHLAEAEVPLRQRGRRHAHALRRSDDRGMAGVRFLTLKGHVAKSVFIKNKQKIESLGRIFSYARYELVPS